MTEPIDESDPRAVEGLKELQRRMLAHFATPRPRDDRAIHELEGIVRDFRAWFKGRYGAVFPELVPLFLPSLGLVRFYRADLDHSEIRRTLIFLAEGLARTGRQVSAAELAKAVHDAWPDYRPPIDELVERDAVKAN
jgi:hypothetical protein